MKKIIVASDSFKGSVSSSQVAEAARRGVKQVLPDCEVVGVPVADGGEGTAQAIVSAKGGGVVHAVAHDPLMRPVECGYCLIDQGRTAVIDMASASGLSLLTQEERNPMTATSYGTGELILDAIGRGCRHIIIGVGGTATCDGGMGIMQALGYRFLDAEGMEVPPGGGSLPQITSMAFNGNPLPDTVKFTVLCDVTNSLYGKDGAAAVFGPQKGADTQMVHILDAGLRNLARIVEGYNGCDMGNLRGAGAGGGSAALLYALCGGKIVRGIEYVLEAAGLSEMLEDADLVITGEGRMDSQTLKGKVPMGVLEAAKAHNVPVVAIAGEVLNADELLTAGFSVVRAIHSSPPSEEDIADEDLTMRLIARTVGELVLS